MPVYQLPQNGNNTVQCCNHEQETPSQDQAMTKNSQNDLQRYTGHILIMMLKTSSGMTGLCCTHLEPV